MFIHSVDWKWDYDKFQIKNKSSNAAGEYRAGYILRAVVWFKPGDQRPGGEDN